MAANQVPGFKEIHPTLLWIVVPFCRAHLNFLSFFILCTIGTEDELPIPTQVLLSRIKSEQQQRRGSALEM